MCCPCASFRRGRDAKGRRPTVHGVRLERACRCRRPGGSIAIATGGLGLGAVLGKLCAMSISFAVVYSLRRGVVLACRA